MAPMTLVLFDIDGTLLRSGGCGRAAMAQAAGELYGRSDMFDDLSFAGAVDSSIVPQALESVGIPPTARRVGRLHARYVRRLTRALRRRVGSLCPGVPEIIAPIRALAQVGLLTGNWEDGARVKLEAFGLLGLFEGCVGAYGGDASARNELVPIAFQRSLRRFSGLSRIVVIGDTPADVECARAGHLALEPYGVEVLSVAVETGFATREQLRAAKPHLQISDFVSGREDLVDLVRG